MSTEEKTTGLALYYHDIRAVETVFQSCSAKHAFKSVIRL